jgi:molecular chaperone DnaK (HSP70)
MSLDIDGILKVTAIEKETGKSKQITIENALQPKSDEEIAEARNRLEALYATHTAGLESLHDELEDAETANEEDRTDNIIEVPFETIRDPGRGETASEESQNKILEFYSPWSQAHRNAVSLLD